MMFMYIYTYDKMSTLSVLHVIKEIYLIWHDAALTHGSHDLLSYVVFWIHHITLDDSK